MALLLRSFVSIASLVAFSQMAFALPISCVESRNVDRPLRYTVLVNSEWTEATVHYEGKPVGFGQLTCSKGQEENPFLVCHTNAPVADAGYTATFFRGSNYEVSANLYKVTIAGQHLAAAMECMEPVP